MKLFLILLAGCVLAQDPREILKRAMEKDERNLSLLDTYMYERRTLQRMYEKDGKLKETTDKVHEVFHVDGSEIERLMMKNGKALSEKDQEAERKRVDKEIAKIKNESPKDRARRRSAAADWVGGSGRSSEMDMGTPGEGGSVCGVVLRAPEVTDRGRLQRAPGRCGGACAVGRSRDKD